VNTAVRDLGVPSQNPRGVFASRWIVGVRGIPLCSVRWDAVVQDRVFEKLFEELGVRSTRQCFVRELQLERGPAFGAEFARERLLNFAKADTGICSGQHQLQSRQCCGFTSAYGFEPALGFSSEGIEAALRSELADHCTILPLVPCIRSPSRPERGSNAVCSDRWVGASSLAADWWRPNAHWHAVSDQRAALSTHQKLN
jgi:hypothetical protein